MNITIVLPGKCNARCDFCHWDGSSASMPVANGYVGIVEESLMTAPQEYCDITVTGGEPTLSPYFKDIRDAVLRAKNARGYRRTVLNTNGHFAIDLQRNINVVMGFDHINISRHSVDDEENRQIFKTYSVPSSEQIAAACRIGLPITLNRISSETDDMTDIAAFAKYAKEVGSRNVFFRQLSHDGILPDWYSGTPATIRNSYRIFDDGGCPACRSFSFEIDGMQCTWKQSTKEPSIAIGDVYEMIIMPDGKGYSDWSGKHEIHSAANGISKYISEIAAMKKHIDQLQNALREQGDGIPRLSHPTNSIYHMGCGGGGGCA